MAACGLRRNSGILALWRRWGDSPRASGSSPKYSQASARPPLTTPLATTVNPVGGTAGGGIEFAISPNWSVKAEYLYVDFQNETIGPGTFKLIENVVRGGVNYRF